MKLTFLGTSHSTPKKNQRCSSTLLEVNGHKYLIDIGCDATSALVDLDIYPDQIEAIFITHHHSDHTSGIFSFVSTCNWYYKNGNPKIYVPNVKLKNIINEYIVFNGQPDIREGIAFFEEKEGLIFDDKNIKVYAVNNSHMQRSYSFIIEAEGKKLLFSGDLSEANNIFDYDRITENKYFDICICECAHFSASIYKNSLKKNPPGLFCLNHYTIGFYDSCLKLKEELKDVVPVILLTDNYEINL